MSRSLLSIYASISINIIATLVAKVKNIVRRDSGEWGNGDWWRAVGFGRVCTAIKRLVRESDGKSFHYLFG